MIKDIKNILNKILENPDKCDLEIFPGSTIFKIKETVATISYKFGDNKFTIYPYSNTESISILKNAVLIKKIECSHEDFLEIELLISKIVKVYKDKSYDEFIHSFDYPITDNNEIEDD